MKRTSNYNAWATKLTLPQKTSRFNKKKKFSTFNKNRNKRQLLSLTTTICLKGANEEQDSFVIPITGEIKDACQDQFSVNIERVKNYECKKHKNPQYLIGFFDQPSKLTASRPSDPVETSSLIGKATWDAQVK